MNKLRSVETLRFCIAKCTAVDALRFKKVVCGTAKLLQFSFSEHLSGEVLLYSDSSYVGI